MDNGGDGSRSGSEIDLLNYEVNGEDLSIGFDSKDDSLATRLSRGKNGYVYKPLAKGEIKLAFFKFLRMCRSL